MKELKVCMAAFLLASIGFGCSNQPSEAEEKQAQEAMQQQDEEMKELLPVNID